MVKLTYGTFSILFKSEWEKMISKEEKENKNVSSVNKRIVECSGMGGYWWLVRATVLKVWS